ncbi:MAG: arginine repressor [Lachnospirales bacterium]
MKIKRQSKLLEIIGKNEIDTQEMLVDMLNKEGFNVTQATVSRDIRELKISKVSTENGKQKYVVSPSDKTTHNEKLIRVFNEGVSSIDYAQNIIVIKTLTGMAMAVAAAIDSMNNIEIMGTIAGDDTIFCVTKSEVAAIKIIERLKANITAN